MQLHQKHETKKKDKRQSEKKENSDTVPLQRRSVTMQVLKSTRTLWWLVLSQWTHNTHSTSVTHHFWHSCVAERVFLSLSLFRGFVYRLWECSRPSGSARLDALWGISGTMEKLREGGWGCWSVELQPRECICVMIPLSFFFTSVINAYVLVCSGAAAWWSLACLVIGIIF